jgi:copper resistance protein B
MSARFLLAAVLVAVALAAPAIASAQSDQQPAPPAPAADPVTDAAGHKPSPTTPQGVPPLTDEDRAIAFPQVEGHAVHDNAVHYLVLFDQLEWQIGGGSRRGSWDTKGWVGRDINRLWFRTEGEFASDRLVGSQAHVLYGRAFARWWEVVAGVRQDVRPGPAQTWAAIGIQGLAPFWFDVEATAYIGASGRTHFRFETEYELLLTNRLVAQPLVEIEIYGKDDPSRGFAAGLSTGDVGLRVRYEIRRQLAPYVGVTWQRKFFGTADLAREAGEPTAQTRLVLGVRFWM